MDCCSVRRGACAMSVAIATLAACDRMEAAGDQKRVLVLHSTRRDSLLSTVSDRELSRRVGNGDQIVSVDYYSEYLDFERFPDERYRTAFRNFLRRKYAGERFDLVMAIEDGSLEFLDQYRNELFPGSPIVFYAVSSGARRVNSTGVVVRPEFGRTLTFALTLQPDVTQVF